MALQVETKDCTALGDTEFAEMADLCAAGPSGFETGFLSKEAEAWVLASLAHRGTDLVGFSFSTLERIGGTPSILLGLASVARDPKRADVLKALMSEQYRRAVLAFPDEDVLVGVRMADPAGFDALEILDDIVPRPDHKASGEERAWGRRLAKRFGLSGYDDRAFIATGDGTFPTSLDHERDDADSIDSAVAALFGDVDRDRGDAMVAFGWAMAEDLAAL